MKETNRSELRKIIMTVLYQISVYKSNKIKYDIKDVIKEYKMGEITIKALDNTNFSIAKGELVAIVGPSGAGKTTTLNILGGMDKVTSGKVFDGRTNLLEAFKTVRGYN